MGVRVGVRVGASVDVGKDVSDGAIVEVNVGLGESVGATEVSGKVCVGRIESGNCFAVGDGFSIPEKTATIIATVVMSRSMAKTT